jgi:hypothetical protein
MNLLITYTHDSELQAITALHLSTIHKSPQHSLNLFQPAVSSPTVPWQLLLTVEILQLHALRSCLHSLACRTVLSALSLITSRQGPHRKQPFYCCARVCCGRNVLTEWLLRNGLVYWPISWSLPSNGCACYSHFKIVLRV